MDGRGGVRAMRERGRQAGAGEEGRRRARRAIHSCLLWLIALLVSGMPALGQTETLYVIDHLRVALRDGPLETAAAIKTLETGAILQALERSGNFVRVRDRQGAEGWVEARFLGPEPPARLQLAATREELTRARAELKALRAELERSQAQVKSLEAALAQQKAPTADNPPTPTAAAPAAPPSPEGLASRAHVLWAVISFAMLGIGFALGVVWLREQQRRKLGGMYLRI